MTVGKYHSKSRITESNINDGVGSIWYDFGVSPQSLIIDVLVSREHFLCVFLWVFLVKSGSFTVEWRSTVTLLLAKN
jgi:hypothetical protein